MDNNTNTPENVDTVATPAAETNSATTTTETTTTESTSAPAEAQKVEVSSEVTAESVVKSADGSYPASIVPVKAKLEPLRPTASELSTMSVEVIHVFVFVLITAFIFLSMWKEAKKSA